MSNTSSRTSGWFDVTSDEFSKLIRPKQNPEALTKSILTIVGVILTPITLIGAVVGYMRGYNRFMRPRYEYPDLAPLRPIVRIAMIIGAIVIWLLLLFLVNVVIKYALSFFGSSYYYSAAFVYRILAINIGLTLLVLLFFSSWRAGVTNFISESRRHGTARFAWMEELLPFTKFGGIYVGGGYYYNKPGHLLTVAATRSGKGTNLILPNLLMPRLFNGSWVVIDPKGENAAVSARIQREAGKKVIMLNPWNLLDLGNSVYNPLDIIKLDRINLTDDVQMIAECIVPMGNGGKENDYWDNRARSFISGMLLHLVTEKTAQDRHLGTLWQWLRLPSEEWQDLLSEMGTNENEDVGDIVRSTSFEIINLMKNSSKEYASVISTAQRWTDFLKSPALRQSMTVTNEFDSSNLEYGNVVVYVIIPADRLKTQSQWLRLVVSSLMRSVIRNPKHDVCFLLDEFYALGYLSEIDAALGSYAGYGVHVWAILQNLTQLQDLYRHSWENFLSSCSVRHFFNVSDNMTAEYVSKLFGQTSVPQFDGTGRVKGASPRSLVTTDELRRQSGDLIYTVIDQLAPTRFTKLTYMQMKLDHDKNPYIKA